MSCNKELPKQSFTHVTSTWMHNALETKKENKTCKPYFLVNKKKHVTQFTVFVCHKKFWCILCCTLPFHSTGDCDAVDTFVKKSYKGTCFLE